MNTGSPSRSMPLDGVLVVEFGQALAGPYAAQLLGDLGARVIKVEKLGGDDSRGMPPHFISDSSAYFMSVNHSKESIVLDLKSDTGRELALKLVAKANIVIENNRPGVMERLGLGYEAMCAANPKIVLCSITGFGQDGPYRDLPAYDMIVQAMSGGMSITGEPTGKPVRAGVPVGDMGAGMTGALAAVAALRAADQTGQPQHLDISMLDVQVSMLSYQFMYHLYSGIVPSLQGRAHSGIPEMGAYEARDGVEVLLAPLGANMWPRVCEALGREDLLADPTLAERTERAARREELRATLEKTFLTRDSADWVARLREKGVPATGINTLDKVVADPQIQHRDLIVDLDYDGVPIRVVGSPIKVEGADQTYQNPPKLGEDTRAILRDDLGLTDADIAAYAAAEAVFIPA